MSGGPLPTKRWFMKMLKRAWERAEKEKEE